MLSGLFFGLGSGQDFLGGRSFLLRARLGFMGCERIFQLGGVLAGGDPLG